MPPRTWRRGEALAPISGLWRGRRDPASRAYFKERSEALLVLISDAMGKEAIREADTSGEGDVAAFVDEPDDIPEGAQGNRAGSF